MFTHIIGQSKIGQNRDLKFLLEDCFNNNFLYFKEKEKYLIELKKKIIYKNWIIKILNDIDYMNLGEFSFYDIILDNMILFNFLPNRFNFNCNDLKSSLEAAKGTKDQNPLEMSKWFNTNYHYMVPEYYISTFFYFNNIFYQDLKFSILIEKKIKFITIGVFTLLKIGKIKDNYLKNKLLLLPSLIKEYVKFLNHLNGFKNIKIIQIEEPVLSLNVSTSWIKCIKNIYNTLCLYFSNLLFCTYFENINKNFINYLKKIKFLSIHFDIYSKLNQVDFFLNNYEFKNISLGIISGRNIWINNLEKSWYIIEKFIIKKQTVFISTSCSLMLVPIDKEQERENIKKIYDWVSFGNQKIKEIRSLKFLILNNLKEKDKFFINKFFIKNIFFIKNKKKSKLIFIKKVQKKIKNININDFKYRSCYKLRNEKQKKYFKLESLTTTTIGSFPQTKKIRRIRKDFKNNLLRKLTYENLIKREINYIIKKQNDFGLDVLVHGEPERSDMVEYFSELLEGFISTKFGWVQSYGTRYVRPPIIYGDIYLKKYMTINWSKYSQKLTNKPVKGMLTGPLTMMKWSYNREDQPNYLTAIQISLSLNREIIKLEKIGIKIIQIDEPAVREFLPLLESDYKNYFNWFIKSFLIIYKNLSDTTQLHTHICYSEFKNIINFIKAIDIDVISIETSRSNFEIISKFKNIENNVGIGIYDIHNSKKLDINFAIYLIKLIINNIDLNKIWINPDCGLKTRKWKEINISLINMIYSLNTAKNLFLSLNV